MTVALPLVVLCTLIFTFSCGLFTILREGGVADKKWKAFRIVEDERCARYLDTVRNSGFFHYANFQASIVALFVLAIQLCYGFYSNCPQNNCFPQLGTVLMVYVLSIFVSFKIHNCWCSRNLCGDRECAARPLGCEQSHLLSPIIPMQDWGTPHP